MFKWLNGPDFASVVLRLGLAGIFLFHGGLKIAFSSTEWNPNLHPAVNAVVAWGEVLCGVACLLGLFSRLAALGIIVIMVGAMWVVTAERGFADIQYGRAAGEEGKAAYRGFSRISPGYEYNFAIIAMAISLAVLGSGPLAIDRLLWRRRAPAEARAGTPPEAQAPASPAPL